MPTITDWLMVGITIVYVAATIAIFCQNKKAAEAAKEQVDEMRSQHEELQKQHEELQRQFKESNRPRIDVELIYEKRAFLALRFVNNGNLTAQQVSINFDDSFINSIEEKTFLELLKKQKDKECIIGVGQHHDIYIGSNELIKSKKETIASGEVIYFYEDNGPYKSIFYIDLNNYATIYSVDTIQDDFLKEVKNLNSIIKEQNIALKDINHNIQIINASNETAEEQ